MHIYQPSDWERVGWSPPQQEHADPPSRRMTFAALAVLAAFGGVGLIMAWLTLTR